MKDQVLEISNLSVTFDTPDGDVEAVRGVSLKISKGECLGVVGESGSGKSQTFLAAFGLTAHNAVVSGSVRFRHREMLGLGRSDLDEIRGRQVAFVGIAVSANQSPERVRRYTAAHMKGFTHFYDARGHAVGDYDVPATSYIVILDRAGKVVYTGVGGDQQLEAALQKALK